MRAEVKKHGDVTIISIAGILHIEETQPFREICKKRFMGEKIVFNMSGANFVGSTGLQSFMDAVKGLDEAGTHGVKVVGLKPEFKRLFASIENARFQYFEDLRSAVDAFLHAPALSFAATVSPAAAVEPTNVIAFQRPAAVKSIDD